MNATELANNLLEARERENPRLGRCYAEAGRYVSSHPGAVLVHGRLINPFKRGYGELDHAWVEEGEHIFDPVMDQRWPKDAYEALFKPTRQAAYSHAETLEKTLETGNWGPWDEA